MKPTNETGSNNRPRVRWALKQLGLPPDSAPEEARKRFLLDLRNGNFPDFAKVEAVAEALGRPQAAGPPDRRSAYARARDEHLGKALAEFEQRFFKLTPEKRLETFLKYAKRIGETEPYRSRLLRLEPGLNVKTEAIESFPRNSKKLAQALVEASALPPLERAKHVEKTIAVFLDRTLLLEASQDLRRHLPGLLETVPEIDASLETRLSAPPARARSAAGRSAAPAKSSSGFPTWPLVLVLLFGVRACGSIATRSGSGGYSPSTSRPSYQAPYSSKPSPELQKILQQLEEDKKRMADPRQNPGPGDARYEDPAEQLNRINEMNRRNMERSFQTPGAPAPPSVPSMPGMPYPPQDPNGINKPRIPGQQPSQPGTPGSRGYRP